MEVLLSALEQGVTPALIVAFYLVISDVIKSRREKNQTKISIETVEAISDIKTIVEDIYNRRESENREKAKIAIDNAFDSAAFNLINFVQRTLISNHIDTNKQSVLANIHNAANAEYYSVFQTLSLYNINGKRVCDYIDSNWLKEIESDLIDTIYNQSLTREDKFMGYINKVTLRFQTYVSYVQNKVLK
jgi:hypothetical protein